MAKKSDTEPEVRVVVRERDHLDELLSRLKGDMTASATNTLRVALEEEISKQRAQALK